MKYLEDLTDNQQQAVAKVAYANKEKIIDKVKEDTGEDIDEIKSAIYPVFNNF